MAKNIDDVITDRRGEDGIQAYYDQVRENVRKAHAVLEMAIDAGAPRRVIDAIKDWRHDAGDTGD